MYLRSFQIWHICFLIPYLPKDTIVWKLDMYAQIVSYKTNGLNMNRENYDRQRTTDS